MGSDQLVEHLETECEARPTCDLCGIKVAASALEEHREAPTKEHMTALLRENSSLKKEVKGLQEQVGALNEALTALGFSTD